MSSKKFAKENIKHFGDRLRKIRDHFNLAQNAFAKKIGSSPGYISEIENGLKMPGTDVVISLKQILHVNINWFLTGLGDMFETSKAEQPNECLVAVPLKKVKAPPLYYTDPVCKKICDICTALNEPSKRAILKMMEGLQSESDFRKWSGEERRKKA
jgi:transcriptional regulator with XRE-family HTH domain